ncbi:MAG: type II/IV secretion system ATPase subunit [Candidatus Woesearchaeota archaeon]
MGKIEHREKTLSMKEAMAKYPHFRKYVIDFTKKVGEPTFVPELTRDMKSIKNPNLIYPVGDPIFIHVYKQGNGSIMYQAIEPQISQEELIIYEKLQDKIVEVANSLPVPDDVTKIGPVLEKLIDMVVEIDDGSSSILKKFSTKLKLTKDQYTVMKYLILRNRVGYGKLDPIFSDPNLEDIHCTGVGNIMTIHKIFDMVYTSVEFKDDIELNKYIIGVSERVERPASDAQSVVDAVMPDGSRANFIYGRDVSLEGSSFTLRKFSEVPVSITQVVNWGTMSAELAAYMWICLENGMNIFVCGETASGKTTSLNAMCAFIKPLDKVYTVENTPEVTMPHDCWQHLLTREAGKRTDVTYQDLLIAALRSRPNYIIIGEIRGQEGNIAFQAMQTGHPVLSTFHAGNPKTMIQRITSPPINVPIGFVDNLNISLIQMAVSHNGHMLRRVLSVTEIERYYAPANQMVTRQVFEWDPVNDKHTFRGLNNSYVLETKIAHMLGMNDTRQIYVELAKRKKIIEKLIQHKIFNYFEVWEILKNYHFVGEQALPFNLNEA